MRPVVNQLPIIFLPSPRVIKAGSGADRPVYPRGIPIGRPPFFRGRTDWGVRLSSGGRRARARIRGRPQRRAIDGVIRIAAGIASG